MKPYKTIKLTQYPDILDITNEGRASHIGRLPEKSGEFKPYAANPIEKRKTRRGLKRRDKAREMRQLRKDGEL